MNNFFLILFLFTTSTLFGQNITDTKGLKQGVWQKTDPNTKALIYKGQFKDNKPVGTFTYYYPNKKIQAIIIHTPNSPRSTATFYHETGTVLSKGIYQNMKKDSIWLSYTPSGTLTMSESFKDDKFDGPRIVYYPPALSDKKVLVMASYINYSKGLINGLKIEYFETGVTKSKANYINNKKTGVCEVYYPSGKVMNQERYKDGVLHGWSFVKEENGVEINRQYYFHGELMEGKKLEAILKQYKDKGINPNN